MSEPLMSNPYAAPYTKDSEIMASEWPIATRSELASHEKLAAMHDASQLNQPLFALIRARKAINDAWLALATARRATEKQYPEVADKLAELSRDHLARAHDEFPLTVVD